MPRGLGCFFALVLWNAHTAGTLLSSSKINRCWESEAGKQCGDAVLLLFRTRGYESSVDVTSVVKEGETIQLKEPLKIKMSVASTLGYASTTLRRFNAKPYEVRSYGSLSSCDPPKSCGVWRDVAGTSQNRGFCCTCSVGEILGLTSRTRRGNPACTLTDSASTTHCLKMSSKWFVGYLLKSPTLESKIQIKITQGATTVADVAMSFVEGQATGIDAGDAELRLSVQAVNGPRMQYLGKVLLYPADASGFLSQEKALVVPRHMLTEDGRQCNMIGTSYEAFVNENNKCFRSTGSCLSNQPDDLIADDLARIAGGKLPEYTLPASTLPGGVHLSSGGHVTGLDRVLEDVVSFDLLLELNAVGVSFTTTLSTAEVQFIDVPPFVSRGLIKVGVKNTGTLAASFSVFVESLSLVIEHASRSISLEPAEQRNITYTATSKVDATIASDAHIAVTVKDAALTVVHNMTTTTQLLADKSIKDKGAQDNAGSGSLAKGNDEEAERVSGSKPCFLDTACLWKYGSIAGGSIVLLGLIILLVKLGGASAILGFLFKTCCCCKSGSSDSSTSSKQVQPPSSTGHRTPHMSMYPQGNTMYPASTMYPPGTYAVPYSYAPAAPASGYPLQSVAVGEDTTGVPPPMPLKTRERSSSAVKTKSAKQSGAKKLSGKSKSGRAGRSSSAPPAVVG